MILRPSGLFGIGRRRYTLDGTVLSAIPPSASTPLNLMNMSRFLISVSLLALSSACTSLPFSHARLATSALTPAASAPPPTYQSPVVRALPSPREPFRLGPEDVISISAYDNEEFNTTQAVRPDGYVAVLSIGDVKAEGRTIAELRQEIELRLIKFIRRPNVNIVINEYNSRKVLILGAVAKPGVVKLKSSKNLLETLSDAGGLGPDADLERSVLFRNSDLVPINFNKLFKHGDISQNIQIEQNDAIFIASRNDNRVYLLGEVGAAGAYTWVGGLTLLEAISLAGGYKRDAETREVLIIKGGLADPKMLLVNPKSVLEEGRLDQNIALESGDIVYVPKTRLASIERYLEFASKALQPILGLESSVILGRGAVDVIRGRKSSVDVSIPVGP